MSCQISMFYLIKWLIAIVFAYLFKNLFNIPYARHYNPRFVYFLPTFWGSFMYCDLSPYVWLVFKSNFYSRGGYSGVCTVIEPCFYKLLFYSLLSLSFYYQRRCTGKKQWYLCIYFIFHTLSLTTFYVNLLLTRPGSILDHCKSVGSPLELRVHTL